MRRLWFFIGILAMVVVPVTMTGSKVVEYARTSKNQIFELHHHIAHSLSLTIETYILQLNNRLAFSNTLGRTSVMSEQLAFVNSALMSNTDFACVAVLDAQGREYVKAFDSSIRDFSRKLDYSQSPFFKEVQESRIADAGAVYEAGGRTFFDTLTPLENGNMLVVSVRMEPLKKLIFEQKVGQEGFIWLLDESGRIIGDANAKNRGRETLPGWSFMKNQKENPAEWSGEFEDPDGISCVGGGTWVSASGWFILSAQPQSEAYATIRSLRRSAFLWMSASFLCLIFFAYIWVAYISVPITKLGQAVINVAQRKFDAKVPEDFGLEEFRALGRAFNTMTKELKAYEALQVEKIVEEHTTGQALLHSMRDGIVMLDSKGQIIFSNEPAHQWTIEVAGRGKDPFEQSWESLQSYPPWTEGLEPVLAGEKKSMLEEFEFPVGGRVKWARVVAQEVQTEAGRLLGVMVVIHDISHEKELDKMKEDFFNGITHDLRTPLAATIGYLGLSEMQVPENEKELAKLMLSASMSAKRALGLVETILSLARLQAGKLELSKTKVQAKAMVERIATQLTFHSNAKNISLSYECNDESLWVTADPAMLERVIENLTGNAIKYTMEHGWVKLSARAVANGVEFAITDNGRGIPPEAVKKLFGKFQQVRAEDKAVGFGIGLAFSKGIVEAHGSTIEVESEVGKGSRFYFVIERCSPPEALEQSAAA